MSDLDRISRAAAPVRRSFVERRGDDRSPLGTLLSGTAAPAGGGGRGGRLRVAVLVTLIFVLAQAPHTTTRVARYWAGLLGLEDPEGTGARAIRDALHQLEERGFIKLTETPSGVLEIRLLSEAGTREHYTIPDPGLQELYFRVPRSLWADGLITRLSGRGLALYLIVLSNAGWGEREFWINQKLFAERYGLGETTRKKGLKELVDLGVLDVVSVSQGLSGTRSFRRNVYSINSKYRIPAGPSSQPVSPLLGPN